MKRILVALSLSLLVAVSFVDSSLALQIDLFSDDFNDNVIDPARWTADITGQGSVSEQNQRLEFTILGQSSPRHVYLQSATFSAQNWTSIDFTGQWAIPSPRTAEFDLFIHNADDPSEYFRVNYQSWGGPYLHLVDSGPRIFSVRRTPPGTLTDFLLLFTETGWEYWENGMLVNSLPSSTMAGADNFYIRLGGWDYSYYPNQIIYYDTITVSAETTVVPEPATLFLLGPSLLTFFGLRRRRHL